MCRDSVYIYICKGGQRPIGRLVFIGHFPQKSPVISGFFAENDLQLKASYVFLPRRDSVYVYMQ